MIKALVIKLAKKNYIETLNDIQAMETNQIELQELNYQAWKQYQIIRSVK